MNKIWILTSEHNDYNQHGEYFLAAFAAKPTVANLATACNSLSIPIGETIAEGITFLSTLIEKGTIKVMPAEITYHLIEIPLL